MGSGRPERIFADASTVRSRWPRTLSAAEWDVPAGATSHIYAMDSQLGVMLRWLAEAAADSRRISESQLTVS